LSNTPETCLASIDVVPVRSEPTGSTDAPGLQVRIRPPTPSDGQALWRLADDVGLDLNSPYFYVLWGDRFADTSTVAETGSGEVVGFVAGFRVPSDPGTLFVWQIGVASAARRTGLGGRMLDDLLIRTGARWLEATVTPDNAASAALFTGVAERHRAELIVSSAYGADLFPQGHEAELLYRLGPFDEERSATGAEDGTTPPASN
jgi:L-2,4-diaminobutyric acid acetyltransferase